MKRILLLIFVLMVSVFIFGCNSSEKTSQDEIQQNEEPQQKVETDEEIIKDLVTAFGGKLQNVSLLAPQEVLVKSLEENYADYVVPALLEEWKANPQKAPGRMVSSPWPDRIEITSIEKTSNTAYTVQGDIIEVTSTEQETGEAAAKQPVTLKVKKADGSWLIHEVTLGTRAEKEEATDEEEAEDNKIVYKNTQYGFTFTLPETWRGYSIIDDQWEGVSIGDSEEQGTAVTGPMILIRHPQWTDENKRQDIPIMILTISQWDSMQKEEFHIGAAPINPKELGRNQDYVFALPARYNFSFLTGFEEVEDILNNHPLQPL